MYKSRDTGFSPDYLRPFNALKSSTVRVLVILFIWSSVWAMIGCISPIDAMRWSPEAVKPIDAETVLAETHQLTAGLHGPEQPLVSGDGSVVVGTADGKIWRLTRGSTTLLASVPGRVAGLALDQSGRVLIAAGRAGLWRMDGLDDGGGGLPRQLKELSWANDVIFDARRSLIFVSDSSNRFGNKAVARFLLLEALDPRKVGKVVAFKEDGSASWTLSKGLAFANGLALWPDGESLLVAETFRYRISRVFLDGEGHETGREVFASNLPGMPDGLAWGPDGLLWVAMPTQRSPTLDWLHNKPRIKNWIASLPALLLPDANKNGLVVGLDQNGKIAKVLIMNGRSKPAGITGLVWNGDDLLLSEGLGQRVWRVRISMDQPINQNDLR